jgi:hypothetical protein
VAGGRDCGAKYRNCVDTSWPDRYNFAARQAVLGPFAQQAANGHFINQTIWNWYFVPGTDQLNTAGMEKLDSIARSTPAPDPKLFLQAARDVPPSPDNLDKLAALRDDLTARRAAAVQRYMAAQPGSTVLYEIAVHDAPVPGIRADFAMNSFRGQRIGYVGGLMVAPFAGQASTGNVNVGGGGGNISGAGGVGAAAGAGGGGAGGF